MVDCRVGTEFRFRRQLSQDVTINKPCVCKRLIEFAVGEQPSVVGDLAAEEFELQAAVEFGVAIRRFGRHRLGSPVILAWWACQPPFFKGLTHAPRFRG